MSAESRHALAIADPGRHFAVKDGLPFISSLIAQARPLKSSSIQRGWSGQQLERRSSCGAIHRNVAR